MVHRITFNTGRKYTNEGQVITAELHDDGKVIFDDSSRHIWGEFQTKEVEFVLLQWTKDTEAFARGVMRRYDSHTYDMGRNGLPREQKIHNFRL